MVKKESFWLLLIILVVTLYLNNCFIYRVSDIGAFVTEEQLNKDVEIILGQYGLNKNTYPMIEDNGANYYCTYYENDEIGDGKVIYLHVTTKFNADLSRYIEIESMMAMWLYIKDRQLPFDIDGISYYYKEAYKYTSSSLVRMSKKDFMDMYEAVSMLTYEEQVEELTRAFIEIYEYKRAPGHVFGDDQ